MVTLSEVKERKLLVAVCFFVSLSPSLSSMPSCITNSMHFLRPRFGSVDPTGRGQSVRPMAIRVQLPFLSYSIDIVKSEPTCWTKRLPAACILYLCPPLTSIQRLVFEETPAALIMPVAGQVTLFDAALSTFLTMKHFM